MFSGGTQLGTCVAFAAVGLLLTSCGTPTDSQDDSSSSPHATAVAAPAQRTNVGDFAAPAQVLPPGGNDSQGAGSGGDSSTGSTGSGSAATDTAPLGPEHSPRVPGLGPEMSAQIPAETSQVLVAGGSDASSDSGTLSFYQFDDDTWTKRKTSDIHNGKNGWLADRHEGDKTTPIGVFTLSDAGGFEENPGTKLPYAQDDRLPSSATVAYGPQYDRVFDYIIAIDYNRAPGTPPTDKTRPLGWDKGGGIWLHLDHDSGTNGCVTLAEKDLTWILKNIDPDSHPRIAMGPESDLKK